MAKKPIETLEDLVSISGTAAANLGLNQQEIKDKKERSESKPTKPRLNLPKEKIKIVKDYLSGPYTKWSLVPSEIELDEKNGIARIWFDDEDEDPYEIEPFRFYICVPIYIFWGRKKREKYLKEQKAHLEMVYKKWNQDRPRNLADG